VPFIGQLAGWAIALAGIGKALNIVTFGGFSKMLGPIGAWLGKTKLVTDLVFKFRFGLLLLKEAVLGLLRSLGGMVVEFLAAIGPIGWTIIAVAALVAGFIYAYKHSEKFRKVIHAVLNAVKTAAVAVFNFFKDHWKLIAALIFGPVGIAVALVVKYWDQIKAAFVTAFKFLVNAVKTGLAPIIAVWKAVWGLFGPLVKAVFGLIVAIIKLSLAIVFLAVAVIIRGIYELVKFIWNQITTATSTAWNAIKTVISGVLTGIRVAVAAGVAVIKAVVSAAWNVIRAVTARVWNGLKRIIGAVWSVIGPRVRTAVDGIKRVLTAAWNAVLAATKRVWNGLKRVIGPAIQAVMDKVRGIKDKIVNFFSGAKDWLVDAGKAIVNGLVDGINKVKDKVEGAVKGVMKKARDMLPFSPAKKGPFSGKGWSLYSGQSIVQALAKGITDKAPHAVKAVNSLMAGVQQRVGSVNGTALGAITANVRADSAIPRLGGRSSASAPSATTSTSTKNVSITNNIYNPAPERSGKSVSSVLRSRAVEAGWV
jgi:phage-related protein